MLADVHVLATVYNEEAFLSHSISSYLPYVKSLTIVEGAYRETVALGAPLRSSDKTLKIATSFLGDHSKVKVVEANEKSDCQQRNLGLELIKKRNPNGWLLIVDGDEVYNPITLKMIDVLTKKMALHDTRAAYFKSLTFVNDFDHYCVQEFPRLFKITPTCSFINDNYMTWNDGTEWHPPHVVKVPNIEFFHYSFCKGKSRFLLKKEWWQTRFGKSFEYSWKIDEEGKIVDTQHDIKKFTGQHPKIMQTHQLFKDKVKK